MKSKLNPPKDGEAFLALVDGAEPYWEIFFWAIKDDGVDKACYIGRNWFKMPRILKWEPLPAVEVL